MKLPIDDTEIVWYKHYCYDAHNFKAQFYLMSWHVKLRLRSRKDFFLPLSDSSIKIESDYKRQDIPLDQESSREESRSTRLKEMKEQKNHQKISQKNPECIGVRLRNTCSTPNIWNPRKIIARLSKISSSMETIVKAFLDALNEEAQKNFFAFATCLAASRKHQSDCFSSDRLFVHSLRSLLIAMINLFNENKLLVVVVVILSLYVSSPVQVSSTWSAFVNANEPMW